MTLVEVWFVPVGRTAPVGDLTRAEVERISTLGFAADRDRAVTARSAARRRLGERLGLAPRDVPLRTDRDLSNGRPVVAGTDLRVSWSHSGAWVALALADGLDVGVDVEELTGALDVDVEGLVAREAAGKAAGVGLFGTVPVGVEVRALPAPVGYVAAVAAVGADWTVEIGPCRRRG